MFCPKCGTAILDGAKFCYACGNSLDFLNGTSNISSNTTFTEEEYENMPLDKLIDLANQDDVRALEEVISKYYCDDGNLALAMPWIQKGIYKYNNAYAKYILGDLYYESAEKYNYTQDVQRTIKLWREAADQGEVFAMSALGDMYRRGGYLTREEAVYYLKKAAAENYADAEFELGLIYSAVLDDDANFEEAKFWFERSYEHSNHNKIILYNMAHMSWLNKADIDCARYLAAFISRNDLDAEDLNDAGELYENIGMYGKAEECFQRARASE